MIVPTIGRIVWYWPSKHDTMFRDGSTQPCAAIVAYVWHDRMVNLTVSDHNGDVHKRTSVRLRQDGDELPNESYCEWMPYQKAVASGTLAPNHHAKPVSA
jgi:hypothetical protein